MENPVNLKVPREEAEKLIRSYIQKGQEIKDMNILSEEDLTQAHSRRKSWKSVTTDFLESIFTNDKFTKEFNRPFSGMVYTGMSPLERRAGQFESWIQEDIDYLSTLIDRLQFIPSLDKENHKKIDQDSNDPVFVVHGHDEAMNQQVLRFLEKLGLKAIDLREQPGGTLSMQEKLEKYSSVKFAVVLFTADDFGRLATAQEENPRNRQNVIFELAGFQKQLGKDHVVIMQKEKTELPSDISGIHYISWNDTYDGWKILLAREMKNAGVSFDFNRIL